MDMFSKEEALKFITERLNVTNVEHRFKSDKKNLLDEIVTNIQTHLIFQNIKLLSVAPEKRGRPSLEDIKSDVLSGVGGLCFTLNTATYYLLKAIGYKATIAHASVTSALVFENNHVIVYVDDVERIGDKFIVEVGFGFPTFRAVCVDFEKESPEYIDSFIEYKYIKYEGKLLRMHRKGEINKNQEENSIDGVNFFLDGWRRIYFADLEGTNDIERFFPFLHEVYINPIASPFHVSFRAISFPGRKALMVINEKTLIENDEGVLVPTPIEGGDEGIIKTVRLHFPVLPEDLVRRALTHWRQQK